MGGADNDTRECSVETVMGRIEILQREARAGEDAVGVEADAAGVDARDGYRGVGQGPAEGVCGWVEGDRGEHVRDDGSGHHGGEGVCGQEDWRDVALSG